MRVSGCVPVLSLSPQPLKSKFSFAKVSGKKKEKFFKNLNKLSSPFFLTTDLKTISIFFKIRVGWC
jgi:hypothetical protein